MGKQSAVLQQRDEEHIAACSRAQKFVKFNSDSEDDTPGDPSTAAGTSASWQKPDDEPDSDGTSCGSDSRSRSPPLFVPHEDSWAARQASKLLQDSKLDDAETARLRAERKREKSRRKFERQRARRGDEWAEAKLLKKKNPCKKRARTR
eukprot:CAMPEP_0180527136 /NCGR_PEP_ID=MMETSP1036_2-20121128/60072_1 /TAXON_ID=632150 /ORGANISM="Azadinium spinosum, Strain 3D9" /LENGTH=148 /DNA_ID=CAMNT_0022540545 /DNA_START=12 /DNA_END=455 /DNA_ORIENTATION=+